jgi:methylsterol monooxygenase
MLKHTGRSIVNFITTAGCVYLSLYGVDINHDSATMSMLKLVACVPIADVWFYTTHRILHMNGLYSRIHAVHHEWIVPIPFVAYYAHPVENIISNAGTVIVPLLLTAPSEFISHVWIFLAITQSTVAHTNLKSHQFNSNHNLHHRERNKEFGINLFMDRLFGTSQ